MQLTAPSTHTNPSSAHAVPAPSDTVAAAAGVAAIAVLTLPRTVTANDDGRRVCGNRTLRGDYGILVSGIRGAGPGITESFVGTALRTYDGHGGFTPGRQLARTGHRSSEERAGNRDVRSQRRLHGHLDDLLSRCPVSRRDSLRHRR